jgi:hypothetical protein
MAQGAHQPGPNDLEFAVKVLGAVDDLVLMGRAILRRMTVHHVADEDAVLSTARTLDALSDQRHR